MRRPGAAATTTATTATSPAGGAAPDARGPGRLLAFALALAVVASSLVLAPAPASAGVRARYGGELRVCAPAAPLSPVDPARLATATDVALARLVHGTLFALSADGTLSPELAAAVPEPEAGGRLFRVKLRPGLRFHDGTPLTAQDVAHSLARLLEPAAAGAGPSPFAPISLPLVGAAEAPRVSGLAPAGEVDLQVSLAFSYPDWPRALAHPAAAPLPGGRLTFVSGRTIGLGAFRLDPTPYASASAPLGLLAFADFPMGRPFVDAVRLSVVEARAGSRALALGDVDAVLGSTDKRAAEGPALFTTYLALNPARLGANAAAVRRAIESSVDVRDLARFFVRGAAPMTGLLPPGLESGSSPAAAPVSRPPRPALPEGLSLTLLFDDAADDQRAVAERLQIKLHDVGAAVSLKRATRADYQRSLAQGGYDLALVSFAALPEPGMALAQLVHFARGRDAARELLRLVGAGPDPAARRALASAQAALLRPGLPLLPLYVQSPRLLVGAGVAAVGFDGCGAPALADAWFLEPRPPRFPPGGAGNGGSPPPAGIRRH